MKNMNKISEKFKNLIVTNFCNEKISSKFLQKIDNGNLTKDEDSESHFCVYFVAYDPEVKQIFIGHHKKSGLWLFNGGILIKMNFQARH